MTNQSLQNELQKVEKLIPKLDTYWQREIQELPKEVAEEIKQISVIPAYTSGGLEAVASVLKDLYIAKTLLKDEIEAQTTQSVAPKIKTKTPPPIQLKPQITPATTTPVKPQTTQKENNLPATTPQTIIAKKETALPVKQNITVQNIQVNKPQLPAPSTKPTIPPTVNKPPASIDFGQYYNKNKPTP